MKSAAALIGYEADLLLIELIGGASILFGDSGYGIEVRLLRRRREVAASAT